MGKTLIICNSFEDQIDPIVHTLEQLGENNYVRFNCDRIHLDYEIDIFPNEMNFCITVKNSSQQFYAQEFSSVWYTEPEIAAKKHGGIDEDIYAYVKSEYEAAMEAIIACLEMQEVTMVSSPSIIFSMGNKQKQQMIAKKIGFQLPEQLVTTQNATFGTATWATSAVIKPVNSHKDLDDSDPDAELPYTQLVSPELLEGIRAEDVNLDIHYFQERLIQIAEYRVVCFGNQAYAFKITGDYDVDWRKDLNAISFEYIPDFEFNSHCLNYLQETGLNFGSFDLMETKDGIFFIECNSPGYFLFCDEASEIGLAEKFATYLVS